MAAELWPSITPSLFQVRTGHRLQLVLTTQVPSSNCGSVLSALTTPLPCILSTPQQKTLPGGHYEVLWGGSSPSSLNVGYMSGDEISPTSSGITPTSQGETEPLAWGP